MRTHRTHTGLAELGTVGAGGGQWEPGLEWARLGHPWSTRGLPQAGLKASRFFSELVILWKSNRCPSEDTPLSLPRGKAVSGGGWLTPRRRRALLPNGLQGPSWPGT